MLLWPIRKSRLWRLNRNHLREMSCPPFWRMFCLPHSLRGAYMLGTERIGFAGVNKNVYEELSERVLRQRNKDNS